MRYGRNIGGEPRCERARIRKLIVLTRCKRRGDLFCRFLCDVGEDVIVTKRIAQLCDDILSYTFVDCALRSRGGWWSRCSLPQHRGARQRTSKQTKEHQDEAAHRLPLAADQLRCSSQGARPMSARSRERWVTE